MSLSFPLSVSHSLYLSLSLWLSFSQSVFHSLCLPPPSNFSLLLHSLHVSLSFACLFYSLLSLSLSVWQHLSLPICKSSHFATTCINPLNCFFSVVVSPFPFDLFVSASIWLSASLNLPMSLSLCLSPCLPFSVPSKRCHSLIVSLCLPASPPSVFVFCIPVFLCPPNYLSVCLSTSIPTLSLSACLSLYAPVSTFLFCPSLSTPLDIFLFPLSFSPLFLFLSLQLCHTLSFCLFCSLSLCLCNACLWAMPV